MFEGKKNSDGKPEWSETKFKQDVEMKWTETDDDTLWVVAGNRKQGSDFARKHGIFPKKWHYVESAKELKAVHGSVVYVGTYYQRRNVKDIQAEVDIGVQQKRLKVIYLDE